MMMMVVVVVVVEDQCLRYERRGLKSNVGGSRRLVMRWSLPVPTLSK